MRVPNHLAVIIDGNRRFAQKHGMNIWEGHRQGAEKLEKFLEWCFELNIPQVSVYVLSTENLKRSKRELRKLFKLFRKMFKRWEHETKICEKYKVEVRVRFCGDLKRLPKDMNKTMKKIMKKTEKYNDKILNILIAYGGKLEITQAIKNIIKEYLKKRTEGKNMKITPELVEKYLWIKTPVDLLIRTGGMHRLSNFLPWQTVYAELYVTDTLWPEFTRKELLKAIKWFNNTKRNFGK